MKFLQLKQPKFYVISLLAMLSLLYAYKVGSSEAPCQEVISPGMGVSICYVGMPDESIVADWEIDSPWMAVASPEWGQRYHRRLNDISCFCHKGKVERITFWFEDLNKSIYYSGSCEGGIDAKSGWRDVIDYFGAPDVVHRRADISEKSSDKFTVILMYYKIGLMVHFYNASLEKIVVFGPMQEDDLNKEVMPESRRDSGEVNAIREYAKTVLSKKIPSIKTDP